MIFLLKKERIYSKILPYFFFVSLIFFTQVVFAAELNLSPSSGSYNVGDTIKVRIILVSSDQSANVVSGTVFFPKDLLTVSSISRTSSIVSLWPVEPSYSNINGTSDMEGIILNGYQGTNGVILTLSFKAKAVGNAVIKFTASSIFANDGQGSDILKGTGQASFNILPAKEITKPAPTPVPEAVVAPVIKVSTPVFTDYSKDIKEGEFLVVKGFADPLNDILMTSDGVVISNDGVAHESAIVKSDAQGLFVYVSTRVKGGMYMITAQARNPDGVESEKSLPIKISAVAQVIPQPVSNNSIPTNTLNTFSFIIPIIALIILLILLLIWGWHHILFYRENMRKRLAEARTIISKSFDILNEDVKEEVKIFKKIKAQKPLTNDERLFINQFKKDIEAAEETVLREVKE